MRILHAGWGFQPYRRGGLIGYAEDLMEIQVKNNYQVFYFCTGRANIFFKRTRVKIWKSKKGYQIFELINPPIISGLDLGINKPLLDISDSSTEKAFWDVVNQVKPDVVHFQELLGIPTSVLTQLKAKKIKTIYTIQDYFPLCPTLKLVKYDGVKCTVKVPELGKECVKCCTYAPKNNLKYKFESMFSLFENKRWLKVKSAIRSVIISIKLKSTLGNNLLNVTKTEDFNKRRISNIQHLHACDLILAMSNKAATIFKYYDDFKNIAVLNLTLKHISSITPYKISIKTNRKITFGLINVMGTPLKGRDLVFKLFDRINNCDLSNQLKFVVLGDLSNEAKEKIYQYHFVEYIGRYKTDDLNELLETLKIQVGIVPSIWEEAYGYVGVEFLAKGIPVLGNNIGGISDYLYTGETGWLNNSCTAEGLFDLIQNIIKHPFEIEIINQNLILNRKKYIKELQYHFEEMDVIYKNLVSAV